MCKCKTGIPYPDGTCDQCGKRDHRKALMEHITDGSPCWCEPETEELDDGSTLFIHRRSDN